MPITSLSQYNAINNIVPIDIIVHILHSKGNVELIEILNLLFFV